MKLLVPLLLALGSPAIAQTSEPISYTTVEGIELEGTLTLPKETGRPVPVLLLIAGSGPTDRNGNSGPTLQTNSYAMLADSLARRGVAMLRYDKRVSGTNAKMALQKIKPETNRFENYATDALGFVRQLQADKRFSKVYVAGHSEGSLVGMLVAKQAHAAGFISLAGAGRNIADVLKVQFETALPPAERAAAARMLDTLRMDRPAGTVPLSLLMAGFGPANQPFLRSWMKHDPAIEIAQFKGPVLIIQGKHDIQVAVSEAERLHQARPDAQYVLVDQMSHILKEGPADRAANIKTYKEAALPLMKDVPNAIAAFVRGSK